MTWAAKFKPSLLCGSVAFGSMFLCAAPAFAQERLWQTYIETGNQAHTDGQYATAETMFLAACTEAEGSALTDQQLVSTFDGLASIYSDEKKYEKAEPLYRRTIEIREKLELEPSDLAVAYGNLAENYSHQKKYAEAELLYRRMIEIREKSKSEPSGLAEAYGNLAENYLQQKKGPEAELVLARANALAEENPGTVRLKVASVLERLATTYYSIDRDVAADLLFEKALAFREQEQKPGSGDNDVVNSIRDMAVTLSEQRKFGKARLLAERRIAIYEKNNQPNDLVDALIFLGLTCEGMANYVDAERAYKRALDTLGPDDQAALSTLENYSRMLRYLKREAEAEALEARSEKIRAATQATEEKR